MPFLSRLFLSRADHRVIDAEADFPIGYPALAGDRYTRYMHKRTSLGRMLLSLSLLLLLCGCTAVKNGGYAERSVFYAGGNYVGEVGKQVIQGAMYVEHLKPSRISQRYPLVLFHGAAQTSTNWITTPDGRPGWASYFLEQGYEVYLVDQPARGRSAWHPGFDGNVKNVPAQAAEVFFSASSELGKWPQAKLHTRWPGEGPRRGRKGDPIFDQFYSSQVESLASEAETQTRVKAAGVALLDRIGPSIVMVHSQAGAFGFLLADARPQLVKAVLALEPSGPPIEASPVLGGIKQLAWGVSDIAIAYSPAIKEPTELRVEKETNTDRPDLVACWRQTEPARQLVNLRGIPTLVLVTESSYHAQYDHCTSKWLSQAGVKNDLVRLEDVGIKGNGHMLMLETNNLEIARWVDGWVRRVVR
ncbi:alpha/beta hydrolase [Variovorax saccharolyticus]|uniref:alpha/beta hydrolase n=1 Tax=Variovorax saccharolyticus TaxID=3053516 RepID=UPI0025761B0C|nr:alpha/beta hydrolase [Variovorax sp. J31P216]MDM0029948.1 alpha/beta hydrolase [Variovorax sp. J31P216]